MRYILLISLWSLVSLQIFLFFRKQEHFFKFPFLLIMTFSIMILPTLTYNVNSASTFPDEEYNLMCFNILCCLLAGCLGYEAWKPKITPSTWELNLTRLNKITLVFIIIGIASGIYLFTLNVEAGWYGLPVYVLFLARFLRPAMVIQLTLTIVKRTTEKLIILGITICFLLYALLIGRRSEFGIFFLYTTTIFHFLKGWNIPRWLLPVGLVASIVILNVVPTIRGDFKKADYSGFLTVDYSYELNNYFSGKTRNEIIESAYTIAAYERSGQAGWGAGIWNQLVNQYIPRGILGETFKNSMRLKAPDPAMIRRQHSAKKTFYFYLSPVGYTSAFMEFRYFAFMFFFFFGMIAKYLYEQAKHSGNIFWVMFYTIFSISIPLSNSSYIGELFSLNIVYLFVLFTCALFSAQRKPERIVHILVPTAVKNALVAARAGNQLTNHSGERR
jgi:hypothetical protein